MLKQLARTTYRHRRITVVAWVAILVAAIVVGPQIKGDWSNNDRLDGADSQAAYDLLEAHMPAGNNYSESVVFDHANGHDADINAFLDHARGLENIESVSPLTVSPDGTAALATLTFKETDLDSPVIDQLKTNAEELDKTGVATSFPGYAFSDTSSPNSELIGMIAALAILVFAFGSIVAAGLPILVAVFGVIIGGSIVGILANFMGMGEVTMIVGSMISVGVGIDYTLLIVSRYRSALARLGDPEAAVIDAMEHAGRAVLLAGAIVAVALMGY